MLKIRLQPIGKKKQLTYRFVVQKSTRAIDSEFIDILGHYDPKVKPAKVVIDLDAVDEWVKKGAQISDTARTLINRQRSGKWKDLEKKKKVSKHKKKKDEDEEQEPEGKKPEKKEEKKEEKPKDKKAKEKAAEDKNGKKEKK